MGTPLQPLELRDPVEQVNDQAERGVVEVQFPVQSLDSGHGGHLGRLEPEVTLGISSHLKEPESQEAPHKIGMYAGEACKTVQAQPERAGEWVSLLGGHRWSLGLNAERSRSSSKSRLSSADNDVGTLICASA
jgi:hypothetical protein